MRLDLDNPVSPEIRRAARRIRRSMFMTYSCVLLALVAILVARNVLRPVNVEAAPIETVATGEPGLSANAAAALPMRSRGSLRN